MAYEGMIAETVTVNGHNGDEIEAYYSRPLGAGPHPGVVVIHHFPGWDEWTREVCRKLTQHGYAAVAPHLYSRMEPGPDIADRARAEGGMPDDQVMGDVRGSMRYLRAQPYANGKVGVIGFCSGGRHAFLAACLIPELDAAVDCWGGGVIVPPDQLTERRPVAAIDYAERLQVPLQGIFGNDDANPDVEQVNKTEEVLKRLGKTYEFERYDGAGHAFFCWANPDRYCAAQAVEGWKKVLDFYGRHLMTPVAAAAGAR